MNRFLQTRLICLVAASLIGGGALAAAGILLPAQSPSASTIGMIVGGLVLTSGGSLFACLSLANGSERAALYLSALSRLDRHELTSQSLALELPALKVGDPWSEVLTQIRESLSTQCGRMEVMEQSRHALEIRAQRSAAEQERINSILTSLEEPVLVVDQYNELVMANTRAQELFELDLDSLPTTERALARLIQCEELVDLLQGTHRQKASPHRTIEIEVPASDGTPQWFSVTAKSLKQADQNGEEENPQASGAVAVLRDITSDKAIQKRNAEFVSSVSHEMKTPLAGIKAYVELLADGEAESEETRDEFLAVITSQADRLQRLIENMLDLARIEAGVVSVKKQKQPLNELLEEAVRVMQPAAEAKSIKLETDLSPLYLGVIVDRDMLLQAAINLLSNAVKYTPDGGHVVLRSRTADANIVFEVTDNGVGLSEEDCQAVFNKFYRVEQNSQMATGTGLGLPLVKHIVEDVHNGTITVTSKLGAGSSFTVMLPSAGRHELK
jgi:two-component system phosphate regulon sensor histidine kinase PhoR